MSGNKTTPNQVSVSDFLDSIGGDRLRADSKVLARLMQKITGKPPVMWGARIVGFDSYHYKYESGREGAWAVTGFTPRKSDLSIHLMESGPDQAGLLARLGRHKMGEACLYIRSLSDVDLQALEQLIVDSVTAVRLRHG